MKNSMKNFVAMMLILSIFALTACSGSNSSSQNEDTVSPTGSSGDTPSITEQPVKEGKLLHTLSYVDQAGVLNTGSYVGAEAAVMNLYDNNIVTAEYMVFEKTFYQTSGTWENNGDRMVLSFNEDSYNTAQSFDVTNKDGIDSVIWKFNYEVGACELTLTSDTEFKQLEAADKLSMSVYGYGGMELPQWFINYLQYGERDYSTLPDLLTMADGTPVTNETEYQARRAEMLQLYQDYMYGTMPEEEEYDVAFQVLESGEALEGMAIRKQVRITITTPKGSMSSMMLMYLPKTTSKGTFLGLNFSGNHTVWKDDKIIPSASTDTTSDKWKSGNGSEAGSWPVDEIISQGYALATMCYLDWAADDANTYKDALIHLFEEREGREFTVYGIYAFGMSRAIDYLVTDEDINTKAIASVGTSRLGRVSLWAAANDERITLAIDNVGGGLGRGSYANRISKDETVYHWFTKKWFEFAQVDVMENFPVDAHMLYALVAPRHLYVSIGSQDTHSDPTSMLDAINYSKTVWDKIFHMEVVEDTHYYTTELDEGMYSKGIGYHMHNGWHSVGMVDWKNYLEYMTNYVVQ